MRKYTLKEVEQLTGMSDATLRRKIKAGKLHATLENHQYMVAEVDLPVSQRTLQATEEKIVDSVNSISNNLDVKEILELVNMGYGNISKDHTEGSKTIADKYAETVGPLIQAVTQSMPQTFIDEFTKFSQTVLNNMIALKANGVIQVSTDTTDLTKLAEMVLEGTNLPHKTMQALALHTVQMMHELEGNDMSLASLS